MSFTVTPCTAADFTPRLADVAFDAFAGKSVIINALHPRNDTPEGRGFALESFKEGFANPAQRWFKAASPSGELVGFAQYSTYDLAEGEQLPDITPSGPPGTWSSPEDEAWAQALMVDLIGHRRMLLPEKPRRVVVLSELAISPDFQRSGMGSKLVQVGIELADQLKAALIVDSTPEGRRVYHKHGFVFHHAAELKVPASMAHYPKSSLDFLRRPMEHEQ